jgi:hypothetical protein
VSVIVAAIVYNVVALSLSFFPGFRVGCLAAIFSFGPCPLLLGQITLYREVVPTRHSLDGVDTIANAEPFASICMRFFVAWCIMLSKHLCYPLDLFIPV